MFRLFNKRKNLLGISEMNMDERIKDAKNIYDEPRTLGDLAKSEHSFFRFSQSQPGRSYEKNVFAEYIPGKITEAKDEDIYLSFVTEETIARCFMYGDMLTSLKFDLSDAEFKKIADISFERIGNMFGEYRSKYLLVDKNYSLEDINTIVKLFDYVANKDQLNNIFLHPLCSLEQRLHDFGYYESEKLVKYLKKEFDKNIHIMPDEIRELIKKYMDERQFDN